MVRAALLVGPQHRADRGGQAASQPDLPNVQGISQGGECQVLQPLVQP